MKLSIYSLKQMLFEGEVRSVNCITESGEITILDHHEPLISILKPGSIKIVDAQEQEKYFPSQRGFLEVQSGNAARMIVEQ